MDAMDAHLAAVAPPWLDRAQFPFRSRRVALADGVVQLVDEGEGSPLVMVHGTPTWSYEYRHLVRAFSTTHRCLAPDHLGFGLSDRPDVDYTPEAHARRFAELMSSLALDPVILVVHDFGGPIALDWAVQNPRRVARLVVLNSWMWAFDDDPFMARRAALVRGALGRFLYRWANASLRLLLPSAYGDRSKLTPAIHRQYLAPFPGRDDRERVLFPLAQSLLGSSSFYRSLWDRRQALADVPALVVWGMADSAFQPYLLERWAEALPHAEVHRLSGVGHWPHEEAPEQVVGLLGRWLAGPATAAQVLRG